MQNECNIAKKLMAEFCGRYYSLQHTMKGKTIKGKAMEEVAAIKGKTSHKWSCQSLRFTPADSHFLC